MRRNQVLLVLSFFLFGLINTNQVCSQTLTELEYFFDATDPGIGNGNSIAIQAGTTDLNQLFNIDLTSVSTGLHNIHFRVADSNGDWSILQSRSFIKYEGSTITILDKLEYSVDEILPPGSGTQLTLAPQENIDTLINIGLNNVDIGLHTLFVRVKEANGEWSQAYPSSFIKYTGVNQQKVNRLTYWFDDQEMPNNPNILFNGTEQIDSVFQVDLTGLEDGIHKMYLAAIDARGAQSIVHTQNVQVFGGVSQPIALNTLEYFWNEEVGPGNGININLPQETLIDESFLLDVPTTTELTDEVLTLRVQDVLGRWSVNHSYDIENCPVGVPEAGFETVCTGTFISFIDQSKNAAEVLWDFGDGTTATIYNPLHQFTPGIYEVQQFITNDCGTEVASKELEIFGIEKYTPTDGGPGDIFMDFYGWGFDETTKVRLIKDGVIHESIWDSYSELGNIYRGLVEMHEASLGFYDVELITANETYFYENGFELEETHYEFRLEIMGPNLMRRGVENPYSFRIHNDGNRKAGTVALYVFVPDSTVLTPRDSLIVPPELMTEEFDTLKEYIDVGPDLGYPSVGRLYAYIIYDIPAYNFGDFRVNLNFPVNGKTDIKAWVEGPYSGSWFNWTDPCWRAKANFYWTGLNVGVSLIPGLDCPGTITLQIVGAIGTGIGNAVFGADGVAQSKQGAGLVKSIASMLKDCSGEIAALGTMGASLALEQAADVIFAGEAMTSAALNIAENCDEEEEEEEEKEVEVRNSFDPNMKTGPKGYAAANFMSNEKEWLDYAIFFENVDSATLPAQIVTILDTLDKSVYDLTSFTLKSFGFSDKIVNIPLGRSEFVHVVNLQDNLQLRASFKLDTATAVFRSDFMTIDSSTGDLTADPLAGFLPPNVTHPEGQGHISYSIKMKEGLPNLTTIANKASIYFDNNSVIHTNVWFNLLDIMPPTSTVNGYTEINDTTIQIELEGNDIGSGLKEFEVYVNRNTGGWLKLGDYNNPFTFYGENDILYEFYFQAVDSVGNVELKEQIPELSVQFGEFNDIQILNDNPEWSIYPIPVRDQLFVDLMDNYDNVQLVSIFDVDGKLVHQEKRNNLSSNHFNIDVRNLAMGFHFLEMKFADGKQLRKHFVKF